MVRLTDRPDMTLDVNRGRKTTMQKKTTKKPLICNIHVIEKFMVKFEELANVVCDLVLSQNCKKLLINTSLYCLTSMSVCVEP